MNQSMGFRLGAVLLAVALCSGAAHAESDFISASVDHVDRSDADRLRDVHSHPAAVLRFLEVDSAMTVFDMLAGDGYYSELLARVVGPTGTVYLHNNQGYRGLMNRLPRRLNGQGLEALEIYVREIEDINLPSNSVDLVLLVKVYHDLYYRNNGWNVPPDPFFRTLWRILKPGGILGVIDHRAATGSGASHAQNLHRIDPAFTRQDIEARGFRLTAESILLDNPADDLRSSVFDPAIRGRTARFLHRYQKVPAPGAELPQESRP